MPTQNPQRSRFRFQALVLLGALAGALLGCQKKGPPPASNAPPPIPVSHPVEDEVTDFTEYTGRTDAVLSVTIRPRITGELKAMPFAEGSEVRGPVKLLGATLREGDVLFQVDPDLYAAALEQADGQLSLYKAQKDLAIANYNQDKRGFDAGTVSEFQMNQDTANIEQAKARIKSAEATLRTARLNLSYCTIRASVSGRVSRYYYTIGNQVSANSTMLTTIVSMDQMYGYFDVEERTYQRILQGLKGDISSVKVRMAIEGDTNERKAAEGKASEGKTGVGKTGEGKTAAEKSAADKTAAAKAAEVDAKYPYRGELNFINNQVNPSTGTVALRAVFNNQRTSGGMWKLLPGMFVRVRVDLGSPKRESLIIDRAIGSDQGLKYVYVLDPENKIQYRRVKTGSLQEGGLRVIEPYQPAKSDKDQPTGVKPDEWVVVGGLPQLRPRMEIEPDKVQMPTTFPGGDTTQRRGGEKKK